MDFQPMHDRVLVRPMKASEHPACGLNDGDSDLQDAQEGRIVATGNGLRDEEGMVSPLDVKAGDHILYSQGVGSQVQIGGINLVIIKEADVLGTIG